MISWSLSGEIKICVIRHVSMSFKYVVQLSYPLPTGAYKGQEKKNPLKCLLAKPLIQNLLQQTETFLTHIQQGFMTFMVKLITAKFFLKLPRVYMPHDTIILLFSPFYHYNLVKNL